MAYPIPLNQLAKDAVLALLNRDNKTNLTFEQISFSLPMVTPTGLKRNTKITVSAISGNRLKGSVAMHYNRILLNDYFVVDPLPLSILDVTTTWELIPHLNNQFDLVLTPDDIIQEPIIDNDVTIRASSHSYAWIGSVNVVLGATPLPVGTFLDVGGGALFGVDTMVLLDIG